jgi:transketolase
MRDAFFDALYPIMQENESTFFVAADNGAPSLDKFWDTLPKQCYNVGIAEQQLIGFAAGLAVEGKRVYTYAIAPFVSLRCYEQVKLDACAMNLPICNIGVGAGYAYDIMGPSHHTVEDVSIMRALPNMTIYSPADSVTAAALAQITHETDGAQYVRFDRSGIPALYTDRDVDFREGIVSARSGKDVVIVAHGVMVHNALEIAGHLANRGLDVGVVDLFRLKPINKTRLFEYLNGVDRVVTLEEHLLAGGMGSAIAEIFVDEGVTTPLIRIGQDDRFVFDYGGRQVIWEKYGLDVDTVTKRVLRWMGA